MRACHFMSIRAQEKHIAKPEPYAMNLGKVCSEGGIAF